MSGLGRREGAMWGLRVRAMTGSGRSGRPVAAIVRRGPLTALLVAAATGGAPAGAKAQSPATMASPEYNAAFGAVLRRPGDLEANLRFAEIASRLGDVEAAIGALERLLFYNPENAEVKLQLGLLYESIGARLMSRSYLEEAVASPRLAPALRDRAAAVLASAPGGEEGRRISVFAQAGLRYQTNATLGADSPFGRVLGRDVVLDPSTRRRADWNAFALGIVSLREPLGGTPHHLVANLTSYYARQARLDRLNFGLLELDIGPRFKLPDGLATGASLRPYAVVSGVTLGDRPYLGSYGGGLSLSLPVGASTTLDQTVEFRDRTFRNTRDYPTARDQTGQSWAYIAQIGGAFTDTFGWQARAAYLRTEAEADYNASHQFTVDLAAPIRFSGPIATPGSWLFTPSIGFGSYRYDAPDPAIDPNTRRREREWRAGARLDVPVTDEVGISLAVQYSRVDSTLKNFDATNLSVVIGPTLRF